MQLDDHYFDICLAQWKLAGWRQQEFKLITGTNDLRCTISQKYITFATCPLCL